METKKTDWERIEIDYRQGGKTLRKIAEEHGITHGAINKRAKRDGWTRDLSAKIKAAADAKVSRAAVSSLVSKDTEREVIEAVSSTQAEIRTAQMRKATEHREHLENLIIESKVQGDFVIKVDTSKKLIETWVKAVDTERKVYGITGADEDYTKLATEELKEKIAAYDRKRGIAD